MNANKSESQPALCPVYDIECPSGPQAADACEQRFRSDYNPLTSFRDSEIEHCAIYRMEQKEMTDKDQGYKPGNKSSDDEE